MMDAKKVFPVLLRIQAILSLVGGLIYAVLALLSAPSLNVVVYAGVAFIGYFFWEGCRQVVLDVFTLRESTVTAEHEEASMQAVLRRLSAIEENIKSLNSGEMKQLQDAQKKLDDLHTGLSDILEVTIRKLENIEKKV